MRILIVAQWFPPDLGALPARITEMADVWIRDGHSVTVVTAFPHHPTGCVPPAYRGKWVVRESHKGIDVIRCWLIALPNRRLWQRTICQLSFAATSVLFALWRPERPDVIIISSPPFFTGVAAWIFSTVRRSPLVFEVRDLWPAVFVEMGVMKPGFAFQILRKIEEFFYRAAKRVVVVTRSFRAELESRGVPPEKIAVVPNGADVETYDPALGEPRYRAALGGDGRFLVTFVGTHGIATGLGQILDAADILRDEENIAFAFVGDGAEREDLIRAAAERRLDHVVFHPMVHKEEVKHVYASSDACIVCLKPVAFLEKFIPSKLFEILASEKPVIAAVSGEAADIARKAGSWRVPPGDGRAIAHAVQEIAANPARAREAARRGRAYVAANFNRRVLARRYIEELQAIARR